MSRTLLHMIALAALTSTTVWLAGHNQEQVFAQAPPAATAGQAPARGGRGGGAPPAPPTARASAPTDFTGYWVGIVTEDWRWLMIVPNKGNADSIQLSPAGQAALNAWDPAKDEAEGNQCKGYGAGAISRLPTRAHVTWQDENTLKWETDQGMQTRLFKFGALRRMPRKASARSWQGVSVATWEPVAGGGRGGGPPAAGGRGGPGGPGVPPAATDDDAAPLRRSSGSRGRARKQSKRMAESRDDQLEVRVICARTDFPIAKRQPSPSTFNRCPRPTVCATWSSRRSSRIPNTWPDP